MARRELTTGENFHRLKRTTLLFCAAVLLTRLPGIDVTSSSGILGVSIERVPIDLVRVLLGAAAIYYFIGFGFEAVAEHQSSYDLTGTAEARELKADLASWRERVNADEKHIRAAFDRVQLSEPAITAAIEKIETTLLSVQDNLTRAVKSQPELHERLVRAVETELQQIRSLAYNVGGAILTRQGLLHKLTEVDGTLKDVSRDVKRLLADVKLLRGAQFYAWDVGGVSIAFLAALIALPVPQRIIEVLVG